MERTIAASLSLGSIADTNERSILISSTGSRWSCTSDEKPVPKSSIARPTPIVRSSSSTPSGDAAARDGAALGDLELEQRGRDAGVGEQRPDQPGQVGSSQVARRDVDRDAQLEAVGEPARAHWAIARRSTTSVTRLIRPGLLGERDEAVGPMRPSVGCSQRASASTPTAGPPRSGNFGWYSSTSSPRLDPRAQLAGEHQAVDGVVVLAAE